VLATAPLGLIGAVGTLLLFNQPFGFVAMLGVLSLAGMIMRNSVILVDQITLDRQEGIPVWEAVVGATIRRTRPVVLTALAAILAMIPLSRNVFWGPMAVAIMGGLLVATVLTLLFTPALYAMIFKIQKPEEQEGV
ncbi:MAG: efflux RND transporter permease subunit, partial [Candidatus Micrarchaeota archaeon]